MKELSSVFERIRLEGVPLATPGSMVGTRQARFTILTARLIRLEWATDGQFEDRSTFAFPNRRAETPAFSCEAQETQITIKTEYLHLHYSDDGTPFSAANLSIRVRVDDEWVTWTPGTAATGNLHGTSRTLDQCADAINLDEGILSRDGWAVFNDSGNPVWDIEQTWVESRPETHVQDWYFFGYGHDYKAALKEYTQFGNRIPLVPRYVLGAWWSRFWAYHADDLKQLVKDFDAHEVPLDVLVVDMDWHTPVAWTGYTWNKELFPDPVEFLAWVHHQGLRATLNLHPAQGVQSHEEAYPEFSQRLGLPTGGTDPIKFNGASKDFIQHYFEVLHHPMEEQGVDFWWLDWQQEKDTTIRNLDPLPWLNHLHSRDSTRRGFRSMLYSRWGGLGNHRYPIGFSGDTYATWDSLRFQPYFTATAANVCYGWWSHDIGGHFGAVEPELYARWVQYGAVSPCLRLHSTKDPLAERRPWGFPDEIYQAAKAAIQFRYRMLPYLYSSAWTASQQGLSLCTPMYYEYPDREDAYLARDQYFLGADIIAAPITQTADPQTGLAYVDVWVPDGTWYEFTTLEAYTGPRWVRLFGDIQRIPLLVKAGAVIPMAPSARRTQQIDGSHIILSIFPGAAGTFNFYEDDGITETYRQGVYEITPFTASLNNDEELRLVIGGSEGECPALPAMRTFEVHWHGVNVPNHVEVNGQIYENWHYDQSKRMLTVTLEQVSRRERVEIVVYSAHAKFIAYPDRATRLRLTEAATLAQAAQPALSLDAAFEALTTVKSVNAHVVARLGGPFAHVYEAVVYADAQQSLGKLVLAPPMDGSPFDAEIVWTFKQDGKTLTAAPISLRGCDAEQILNCPFKDEGDPRTFQWSANVTLTWHGLDIKTQHYSRACYPAIMQWQTLMVESESAPSFAKALTEDGKLKAGLAWQLVQQERQSAPNLHQPYGVILLEQERQRITDGEPLAMYASAELTSTTEQDIVLCVQHAGAITCYADGKELNGVEAIEHVTLAPMFYSWIPAQRSYYKLTLKAGVNRVLIYSQPDKGSGWWTFGATAFDLAGNVLS
ncbi:MAG: DUF5110 domain-containing protein [Anaerolineae bacterium]|nr:DUF5110 domain-containing protein [Anaerolineae bacterium]